MLGTKLQRRVSLGEPAGAPAAGEPGRQPIGSQLKPAFTAPTQAQVRLRHVSQLTVSAAWAVDALLSFSPTSRQALSFSPAPAPPPSARTNHERPPHDRQGRHGDGDRRPRHHAPAAAAAGHVRAAAAAEAPGQGVAAPAGHDGAAVHGARGAAGRVRERYAAGTGAAGDAARGAGQEPGGQEGRGRRRPRGAGQGVGPEEPAAVGGRAPVGPHCGRVQDAIRGTAVVRVASALPLLLLRSCCAPAAPATRLPTRNSPLPLPGTTPPRASCGASSSSSGRSPACVSCATPTAGRAGTRS